MTTLTTAAVETAVETAAKAPLAAAKGFLASYKMKIIAVIVAAAIAIGGFLVVQNHWLINKQVATKVENHDLQANNKTLQTQNKVADASAKIDVAAAQKHEKTEKEYIYVRQAIQAAPAQDRNAPASPVIIDTLNGLDRLHSDSTDGVPDANVPVG